MLTSLSSNNSKSNFSLHERKRPASSYKPQMMNISEIVSTGTLSEINQSQMVNSFTQNEN